MKGDGPLNDVPFAAKDLFDIAGRPTLAGSIINRDAAPATRDATAVARLEAAGATCIAIANMDEYAYGFSTENAHYGATCNPHDPARIAGGSSGGSAAAVAGGLVLGATGTDTGGSIRQPAALTGIVGVKPTYGRCSRWGIVAFASSLDQAGPITKTVEDAALLLQSMCSFDAKDSTSLDIATPDWTQSVGKSVKGLRIGVPREYVVDGMPTEIQALWDQGVAWLKDAGAEIVDISLPHTKYALPAYYVIAPAEASSNLARYDGVRYGRRAKLSAGDGITELYEKTRAEGFGPEVQRRIMIGTYVLSAGFYDAYYNRARRVRALIKRDFDQAYAAGVDAILTPATPSSAFALGSMADADPVEMYLNDVFTVTVNMAGLPGLALPGAMAKDGLPLGLQLIGRPFEEEALFALGAAIEKAAPKVELPKSWWG